MVSRMERMEKSYTGRFLETDMFGERFVGEGNVEYKKYEAAIEDVKNDYPGNPSDPRPSFANDLHAEVVEALGLDDKYDEVQFYTAVGSSLDRYHGVDAFFEYNGGRVTLDVTKNPAKAGGYKADLMIGEEEFEYPSRRKEKAKEIADELKYQSTH